MTGTELKTSSFYVQIEGKGWENVNYVHVQPNPALKLVDNDCMNDCPVHDYSNHVQHKSELHQNVQRSKSFFVLVYVGNCGKVCWDKDAEHASKHTPVSEEGIKGSQRKQNKSHRYVDSNEKETD